VGYTRDIRPILAENCFTCHGTDHNKRMAGLRLDMRESALGKGVIVPGHPGKSELIRRIFSLDENVRMPPSYSHKQLKPEQKNLLKRWIAEGAKYERHWSLVPLPAQVAVPSAKDAAWCRNGIDRFVRSRLELEGLKPSPEADRTIWLRRVTLDLTGLVPTPQETDAFLDDRSEQAYARVVDRLLASPRYGERMAVPWLDVARYADSYGYQSDQLCPTWPYRDWVVKAFNQNLPYSQFVTWQLAGDLLPNATRDQRLATEFNRLHRMTNEGGSVAEEWRMEGVADRVKTFGTAFLGYTTECARCHDHKYDPITQRDYYALSAFFNNIDEYGLYDRSDIVPTPSLLLPTPKQERDYKAAVAAVVEREQTLKDLRMQREPEFQQWLAHPSVVQADLVGQFDFERFDGTALSNLAPGATKGGLRDDEMALVSGHRGHAGLFTGENNVHFPEVGRFARYTPFTIALWIKDARAADGPAVVFQGCEGTDVGPHGYDLLIDNGVLTARLFRHWPGNAIAVRARQPIPKATWTHVAVTYDGSSRAAGLKLYVNGVPAQTETLRDHLYKSFGQNTLILGQRFRDRGFKDGQMDDLFLFDRGLTPLEVAQLYDGRNLDQALRQSRQREAELRDYYFSAIDSATREATKSLETARQKQVAAEDEQFETLVMEEMPKPRPTYVLARGRYDAPLTEADRVSRDTPAAILPFPKNLRRDRLGLAEWLTQPNHPLTARVEVNRIWAILFGRGLAETVEDLGIQGKLPSHPELLDWLARDFVQSGWNVKGLVRKIVLSSTYRQSSALRPDLRVRDPQNVLLARGPSQRLSGEEIRDVALQAGGLLNLRAGGPPVSPYQPGDLWRESNSMSPAYRESVGGDLYRRSLYTVWKRTAPMPNMLAFDATTRELCVARRQNTNTPTQALVLLDDPQFVEAARCLGERMLKTGGASDQDRVRYAFRQLATREPNPTETKLLVGLYHDQLALFQANPVDAASLLKIGERKADASLPSSELAAATVVAQTVLNLDATVWKR
jgi:hypothetical protein